MHDSDSFYIIYGEPDKTYTSIQVAEKAATEIVKSDPGRRVVICECIPFKLLQSSRITCQ